MNRNSYDNNPANCEIYGGLYQWDEMMQYTITQGTQGICPTGWHVPTDEEWTSLVDFLGGKNVAGGKMKETGTTNWNFPNTGASNSSGFTALPAGGCYDPNFFDFIGEVATFYSSSEQDTLNALLRTLNYNFSDVLRNNDRKWKGHSVRCLKN